MNKELIYKLEKEGFILEVFEWEGNDYSIEITNLSGTKDTFLFNEEDFNNFVNCIKTV